MHSAKFLRRFVYSGGVALAAVPVVPKAANEDKKNLLLRPSELPIYPTEKSRPVEEFKDDVPSGLEEFVGTIRRELSTVTDGISEYSKKASDIVKENWESSNALLDYLREEENSGARAGAIALGGATGFVWGLRGGFFRRLFYTTIGGGAMAGLCYPKEAEEVFQESLQYASIGYHLVASMLEDLTGSSTSNLEESIEKSAAKPEKKSS